MIGLFKPPSHCTSTYEKARWAEQVGYGWSVFGCILFGLAYVVGVIGACTYAQWRWGGYGIFCVALIAILLAGTGMLVLSWYFMRLQQLYSVTDKLERA